ncbi:cell division protein FtsZ [Sinomicrobium soli]|uniref:cell division protein FtsZ n=1 Tax=Sinomicrobium sp. N-1-3-6 TaxID=2219864 RepID=UPI000DCC67D9|nr:cell division protein FtsZ [Sinomicrobium sp. N-1-3-6]RAV30686.1 cell division protein FtsZ [Sinomicrobium sp. N-1-3-6]
MSSNTDFGNISFDMPKNQSNVIKVIGVGGGGSNAINHMFQLGIKGVDFVVCNTDSQALDNSSVPNKIQLGVSLTEGLGAGANPDVGEKAAIESFEEIKGMLDSNTKMLFITAGMGGGTGTGAAPIIAKMAKELDILTVGIVTIPFQFEGKTRNEQARRGVDNLRSHVDSLIVINNNKLREVYGNLGFKAGFSKADEVLATASRGIAEVITHHYTQNIDLRDAKTVLSNSGTAIMGSAAATGGSRAQDAIVKALDSPLLNDNKITGAKNVLLLIVSGGEEITIDEIGEINDHIQNEAGHGANIIMGVGEDESLGDAISVTIIATGFDIEQQHEIVNTEAKKIIHTLEDEQRAIQDLSPDKTSMTMNFPGETGPARNQEQPAVRHTLTENDGPDLVSTTDIIRNMDVIYDEVYAREEDFVIIDTTEHIRNIEVEAEEIRSAPGEPQQQTTLSFDMPVNKPAKEVNRPATPAKKQSEQSQTRTFELNTDDARNYDVKDHVEVVPVTEVSEEGVRRYSLDDYMEVENRLSNASPKSSPGNEVTDQELAMEKKVVSTPEENAASQEVDPFNTSIEESLKLRAEERRRKLKEFNYRFNNSVSKIDEIEKQPAYKRLGVDLSERSSGDGTSRISVGNDSNEDIQLRTNNSFLHDNVD